MSQRALIYLTATLIHITTRDGFTATVVCLQLYVKGATNHQFQQEAKTEHCMCFEELKSLHNSLCKAAPLDSWRENKHVKINSKISN